MKWILFFIFTANPDGTGPTHVAMHSMQFDDRVSCERAGAAIDEMTRSVRFNARPLTRQCLPASELSLK